MIIISTARKKIRVVLIIRSKTVITAALIAAIFINAGAGAFASSAPETSAVSAVVVNEAGEAVYEKNADARMLIASTTKLMTALIAAERTEPDETVQIKKEYCDIEGSSMYLKPGEVRTVKELMLGMMLVSGNDAAQALACHVAGSAESFAALMNRRARELEMDATHFENPHGLDGERHYSTARDMARLMCACMENERLRDILGTRSAVIGEQELVNHNRLLWKYKGCIAGKTGYTMAAGRCLVTCAERDGTRFICVTLSDGDDWNDQMRLYDWAFSNFEMKNVTEGLSFKVPVVSGSRSFVEAVPEKELKVFVKKSENVEISAELPKFVFAPVNLGETAGKLCVIINGKIADECCLIYAQSAELAQKAASDGQLGEG